MTHWPSLDGLRGIAVSLVLVNHVGLPGYGGPVGVTLFFVLSGFLITTLLMDEIRTHGSIDLPRFYIRRAFRLLPALAGYLVGSSAIALVVGAGRGWVTHEVIPPALYISNYAQLMGWDLQMNWHTWSLAVEEHFYAIWPLVLITVPMMRTVRPLLRVVLFLAAWGVVAMSVNPDWGAYSTDANLYALGAGCLLAVARVSGFRLATPTHAGLAAVVALVGVAALPTPLLTKPLAVAISSVAVWVLVEKESPIMSSKPLRFLGRISYSLYLWQVPLLMLAGRAIGIRVLFALAAVAVSWISWIAIERPLLAYRNRKWASKAKAPPAAALIPLEGTT